jgi:hypothetical protein
LDKNLEVLECQNANNEVEDMYNMNDIPKHEKDMWNHMCSHIESEQLCHAKNEKLSQLIDECSLKAVETDEAIERLGEKVNYFVVKSVKILNSFTANKFNTRVIGEPIVIRISMINPLDIPIQFQCMQLVSGLTVKGSIDDEPYTTARCLNFNAFEDEAAKFLDTSGVCLYIYTIQNKYTY